MKRSTIVVAVVVPMLLAVGFAVLYTPRPHVAGTDLVMSERNMPKALGRHLEGLSQAIPGQGGESEGPGSADAEEFLALAYPDTDVPLARLVAARKAAAALNKKGFPRGKGSAGNWVTAGPSVALYPFTQFRNSFGYVPNTYVASGRTTAIAIDPNCSAAGNCRLWVFAAGGGVWRTKNALDGQPSWKFLSGDFGIQSGSSIALDPNDPSGNTLYVGTGEANASGDSAAGVGLYKSTNGGDTWTGPLGASVFNGRAIGSIVVKPGDPDTIYAGTTRGVLGVSSVTGGGVTLIPGAAVWGLYKSTDGGANWTFLHNGSVNAAACDTVAEASVLANCSIRGVRRVALDPLDPEIVYAGSYHRGVWRSNDGGASWTQIKASLNAGVNTTRPEIAVTALPDGKTRMYVYEGHQNIGAQYSRLFRSDDVASGAPVFTDLTSNNPASPGYGTFNVCTGQCWYDTFVYTPPGHPDIVYVGGSYSYGEQRSNKRGVVLSTDAGVTSTDMTMDATHIYHPNGLHPDQHAIVTHPDNPYQFFEVNDGGVMRSSGAFADVSHWCDDPNRGLAEPSLGRCKQLLSRVPTKLEGLNKGLATLQFQSLSVSPFNVNLLQGGTQDNGTWQTPGNTVKWENTMIGDGGQSGFDAANPNFRFHTFFNATPDVNFSKGDIADWNWIGDPIYGTEPQAFYVPIISDPVVSRTMFVGTGHVWRTKTWGMGAMSVAEFRQHCNEWFGDFAVVCGDWEPLGDPTADGFLTSTAYGDDRTTVPPAAPQYVVAVERAPGDTSTLWAATQGGRVFVSKNAAAEPASAVTFTRIDGLSLVDPGRFVSGIHIDPANANHAWVSYTGFNAATPTNPGHVFEVTYNPAAGTATWVDRSYDLGDIPINDVARDDVTGDLYAASDFGVYRLAAGTTSWGLAAPGMPHVEVAGLTIRTDARRLYAATHGQSAWLLNLP
jgi:hypothetical protein